MHNLCRNLIFEEIHEYLGKNRNNLFSWNWRLKCSRNV
jgi:hypothetical protein